MRVRPWQRLVLDRLLEVDGTGALCWRQAVVSTPRQCGKSILVGLYSLARCAVFDPPQGVLLVANGLRQAVRLHQTWWAWAADEGLRLRKLMDAAEIGFGSGSWWRLSSASAVWGSTADAAVVDEAWDVDPAVAEGALQPVLVTRPSSQLILASTANPETTPLLPSWRLKALDGSERVAIAEWSADPDADPDDPATWRAASPVWDRARADMIADQRGRPLWRENWMNAWPLAAVTQEWPPGWGARRQSLGSPRPGLVAAVEVSADQRRWGVAVAELDGSTVRVWTRTAGSAEAAVGQLQAWKPATVLAGVTLANEVVGSWLVEPVGRKETGWATTDFAAMVGLGRLVHDGDDGVAREVRCARVSETEAGPVLSARRSTGPIPTLKAAVWASWAARDQRFAEANPAIW